MSEQFDNSILDGVDPSTGVREVPDDGDYNLAISSSEYGDTSKGGKGFKMKFTILDGTYAGTEIFHFVNIISNSEQAQNIGRAEMKAIMACAGTEDANDLVGKVLRGRLIGEPSEWADKFGNKRISVNMRIKLFMTTAGKNAKDEAVPDFVPTGTPAKEIVAQKRAAMGTQQSSNSGGQGGTGGGTDQAQTSGHSDIDDDIPF